MTCAQAKAKATSDAADVLLATAQTRSKVLAGQRAKLIAETHALQQLLPVMTARFLIELGAHPQQDPGHAPDEP